MDERLNEEQKLKEKREEVANNRFRFVKYEAGRNVQ